MATMFSVNSSYVAQLIVRYKLHTSTEWVRVAQATKKKNPAGMYDKLASRLRWFHRIIAKNYPGFPPPQNRPPVSSMEVKT